MDTWKYYHVQHKPHVICNPLNMDKFERLCRLLSLKHAAHVLDIACGKGEFLVRLAELYGVSGVGVDISPYCIRDCVEKHHRRVPNAELKFIEMDAAKYKPGTDESFDISLCIGATWVFGGYRGTVQALKRVTKPDGLIVVGEAFWVKDPVEEYLKASGTNREVFGTHGSNVAVGEEEGLTCLYTVVSSHDEWDHYETLKWWAIDNHRRVSPDDPDLPEILERARQEKVVYLKWERDTLGWAVYVFRSPDF